MLVFHVFGLDIPGVIFIPVVATTLFTIGLSLALWLDERAESKAVN